MILVGVGAGLGFPALMTLAMSGATPSDAGLASGLVNTSAQVGGAIGLAVLATLATRAHRGPGGRRRGAGAGAQRRLPPGLPGRRRARRGRALVDRRDRAASRGRGPAAPPAPSASATAPAASRPTRWPDPTVPQDTPPRAPVTPGARGPGSRRHVMPRACPGHASAGGISYSRAGALAARAAAGSRSGRCSSRATTATPRRCGRSSGPAVGWSFVGTGLYAWRRRPEQPHRRADGPARLRLVPLHARRRELAARLHARARRSAGCGAASSSTSA